MLAKSLYSAYGISSHTELTYLLDSQLNMFVGEYTERQLKGLDNHWIIKPFVGSAPAEFAVTSNLDMIIRCMEAGPRLVQKYIERPLLHEGHKLVFQFFVLIRKVLFFINSSSL